MPSSPSRTRHDYIIVGAGSAGCVLAARLTESPGVRVLLLEAGPLDRSWEIEVPAAVSRLLSKERFNWSYVSEPEPALDGRRLTHPRGRVLGGSSSINGMVYIRGHACDYDQWAQAGATGWSYAELLPYFMRAEQHLFGADHYHGAGGPLAVFAPALAATPLATAFVRAATEAGYPLSSDVNGTQQECFGRIDRTTRAGRRCSAARAYFYPARARPGLTLQTGATVRRVLLERGRAVGVEDTVRGVHRQAHADAEVIIAGGAINSPQILHSPVSARPRAGVEPLHDLPAVGGRRSAVGGRRSART